MFARYKVEVIVASLTPYAFNKTLFAHSLLQIATPSGMTFSLPTTVRRTHSGNLARFALLNALNHSCQNRAGRFSTLTRLCSINRSNSVGLKHPLARKHDRRSGEQSGKDLFSGHVETQRSKLEHAIRSPKLILLSHREQWFDSAPMRDHDALRRSRRSRSVDT